MADVIANIIVIVVTVATAAAAIYLARPILWQYLFPKRMIKAIGKFIGKSKDIQLFSHLDSLPGIQYELSEDFIYFRSRQKAYDEVVETLLDDSIHMIGLYGEGGSGKTSLVTEVGKKAEDGKMFDKVISITVSRTPNIRAIQGKIADMLKLKLGEESEEGRAQRLWMCLKRKKQRILFIVNNLWGDLKLNAIGIHLDDDIRKTCKILITAPHERVCTSFKCQKKIHLELLFEDESWNLFQKFAKIDEEHSTVLNDVPRELCNECMGLPIAIKIVGSLFNERKDIEWRQGVAELRASKASDDEEIATSCRHLTNLSYDHLPTQRAKKVFLLCALFPEEYHIQREDLLRYAHGLNDRIKSLQSMRSSFGSAIDTLLKSCLVAPGSVKMHNMVRDAALWIANRSDNCKILVNVDKPLSTVAEDNRIKDCFAVSSWWFNENPSFCQLHAPNLKMPLVNISAHSLLNSLDLSPLTFEGIQGLQVFSLTINYKILPISFPPSIQLLTNVRTLRLNGLKLGDISFIVSLTTLEVLDLRRCYFNELPTEIGKLESLKLLDLSECHISQGYNGAIGKCSQLEELYALPCYPELYVQKIIVDTDNTLPKLQRFVLNHSYFPKEKTFTDLKNLNISMFKGSKMNILQMAETISLTGLHGGCKSIIPDMVGVVGGMNNLSTLHLTDCEEIECIFDTTCDFKEDDMIPRLVELRLESARNLTELCHGPPLQVLHYFEKLELLYIDLCWNLHIIFPSECKLKNLKILSLSKCMTVEVLFSESVAQSMQQLEQLTIKNCSKLKRLIASSGSDHVGCNTSEEIIPAPMNSHFLMSKLRDIDICDCESLESIFPICYVEGLAELQNISIEMAPNLEYVFGKCDHQNHSSHQYKNNDMLPQLQEVFRHSEGDGVMNELEIVLPNLKEITLSELPNFVDICHGCQLHAVKLIKLHISNCPKTASSLKILQVPISAKPDGQGARGLASDQSTVSDLARKGHPTNKGGGSSSTVEMEESTAQSSSKGDTKRGTDAEGEQKSKAAKIKGDVSVGRVATGKNADDSGEARDLENRLETQSKDLWALKDDLKNHVTTAELHEMLDANGEDSTGSELDLRDRCADGMMFGGLSHCPLCSGFLRYSGGMYRCTGYISGWSKCSYSTSEPKRNEGKWKIPKETDNQYLKNWFKSQKGKKPIRLLPPPSSRTSAESQISAGQHQPSNSESLSDLKVAISGLPKESIEEWKHKIDAIGGVFHAKVMKDTDCLVVSGALKDEVEMQKARRMKVPIVREDYLVDCIERKKKLPFDLYKVEMIGEASSMVTIKVKGQSSVHDASGLQDCGHILEDGKSIYNTTLNMSDLSTGINSYYILQIIEEDKGSDFYVFRTWGRVGNDKIGRSKLEQMSKSDAIREFERLFLEKTGNPWKAWEQRTIQKQPGRFFPLEIDYGVNRQVSKNNRNHADSKLPPPLIELIKMLFNVETYRSAMMEFEINMSEMPLGKLSKSNIQKGFEALTDIQNLFKSSNHDPSLRDSLLIDASNRFFTMIPSIHPHIIREEDDFKSKVKMLEALQDIELASRLVGFDANNDDSIDDSYKKLHCDISPLPHDSEDFRLVEKYLHTTYAPTHTDWSLELEEVFSLEREGEFDKYAPYRDKVGNRMLLWHGSRLTNFVGILNQGLRIAPPEAPATGYMFGKGVYFADLVSKSAQYCFTDKKNPVGLMLLSEVALGNVYELKNAEYMDKPPQGKHSTKGLGKKMPLESDYVKWRDDVVVPCGKPVSSNVKASELMYNEYIVYNTAQVKLQFLLKVRFHHKK